MTQCSTWRGMAVGALVLASVFMARPMDVPALSLQKNLWISPSFGASYFMQDRQWLAVGTSFGGELGYGPLPWIGVGVKLHMQRALVSDRMTFFPHAVYTDASAQAPLFAFDWWNQLEDPTTHALQNDGRLRFAQSKNIALELQTMPVEFFVRFKPMADQIFSPYIDLQGGFMPWKVVNSVTNAQMMVESDTALGHVYEINNVGQALLFPRQNYKGTMGLFGATIGFEIQPMPQLGIEIEGTGRLAFRNDFTNVVLDTLAAGVSAQMRLTYYYDFGKGSSGGGRRSGGGGGRRR